jgi:hypothetical protein
MSTMIDDDRRSYPCEHFSQASPLGSEEQSSVPALLRRIADSIEAYGPIDVADIVFRGDESDDDGEPWPSMTVYFTRP